MFVDLVFYNKESDLPELKEWAKKLEIDALILAKTFSGEELERLREILAKEDFPFYLCHVMQSSDAKELRQFKQWADLVCVLGADLQLNKFAVSQKQVDFLLHPVNSGKIEIDTGIMQLAKLNNTKIAFLFNEFNSLQGFPKSLMLKNAFIACQVMAHYKVDALFFTGAKKFEDMRAVKDLKSFAVLLGFSTEQGRRFLELPQTLIEKKSKKKN
ncbi:MAG: hypothetical protein Q7K42_00055 [Candidatus Diapherotrites archaeon]|nr:hypothetical protein [Candidatus Diapherotrites archaeon]